MSYGSKKVKTSSLLLRVKIGECLGKYYTAIMVCICSHYSQMASFAAPIKQER